jgi:hypothetical protein
MNGPCPRLVPGPLFVRAPRLCGSDYVLIRRYRVAQLRFSNPCARTILRVLRLRPSNCLMNWASCTALYKVRSRWVRSSCTIGY